MVDYIINENTLFLTGIDSKSTRIVESDREFLVPFSIHSILDKNCLYFGSSYQGRWDASKYLLNREYKLPILVKQEGFYIFMPIKSVFRCDCVWISFNQIQNYREENGKIYIEFKDYGEVDFDISIKSLESLISKSCILLKNLYFNQKN